MRSFTYLCVLLMFGLLVLIAAAPKRQPAQMTCVELVQADLPPGVQLVPMRLNHRDGSSSEVLIVVTKPK